MASPTATPTPTPTPGPQNTGNSPLVEDYQHPNRPHAGTLLKYQTHKINGVEYNVPIYADGKGGELPFDARGETIGLPIGAKQAPVTRTQVPQEEKSTMTVPGVVYPPGHPRAGQLQDLSLADAKLATDVLEAHAKLRAATDPRTIEAAKVELARAYQAAAKAQLEIDAFPARTWADINAANAAAEAHRATAEATTAEAENRRRAGVYIPAEKEADIGHVLAQTDLTGVQIATAERALTESLSGGRSGLQNAARIIDALPIGDEDKSKIWDTHVAKVFGLMTPDEREQADRAFAAGQRAQTEVERRNLALEEQAQQESQRGAAGALLGAQANQQQRLGEAARIAQDIYAGQVKGAAIGPGDNPVLGFLATLQTLGNYMTTATPSGRQAEDFLTNLMNRGQTQPLPTMGAVVPSMAGSMGAPASPPPGPSTPDQLMAEMAKDTQTIIPEDVLGQAAKNPNPMQALLTAYSEQRGLPIEGVPVGGRGFLGGLGRNIGWGQ